VFVQLVGVTDEEKERMLGSRTQEVLDDLAKENPLLITDLDRSWPVALTRVRPPIPLVDLSD
jgi:hypothetical protein